MTSKKTIVGVLGPELTWSDLAAQHYLRNVQIKLLPSFAELFAALAAGDVEQLFLPIENKFSGSVTPVWRVLRRRGLWLRQAFDLPIIHHLATPKPITEITTVFAHPHALTQCTDFLAENYPQAHLIESSSNAAAFLRARETKQAAAIGASELISAHNFYSITKISTVEDGNTTRFALVDSAPPLSLPTDLQVTSIVFELINEQGSLLRALAALDRLGKNMIRIQSQPSGAAMNDYVFFIDFLGGLTAAEQRKLGTVVCNLQLLGHYEVETF